MICVMLSRRLALFSVFLVLSACRNHTQEASRMTRRPNIVVFFTDDQGYGDLSCYGHPSIRTPHIDRLAHEGAKLTQFYVAAPLCSPSRAALLTGCYPKRVGMQRHVVFPPDDHGLHPHETTIAEVLRDAGYRSGCFGKWHLGHRKGLLPCDQGFDEFFGVPYSNDMAQFHRPKDTKYEFHLPLMHNDRVIEWEPDQRELTRRTTDALIDFLDRMRGQPFFAYVPYSMPHIPIYASDEYRGRSARGLYGDVIEEIDASVGRVLSWLDAHALADDTIVIFTSDNGPWLPFKERGGSAGPLRGGKGSNFEGGQRVPCLVRWPGRVAASSLCTTPMTAMDLLPTLAGFCEAALPDVTIDGRDMGAILRDVPANGSSTSAFAGLPRASHSPAASSCRAMEDSEFVFLYYTSKGDLAGIRKGRWKLLFPNELHDVEVDIGEAWNRAAQHSELVRELTIFANEFDARIEAEARPEHHSADQVFDPRSPKEPNGRPFTMPDGRRRAQ